MTPPAPRFRALLAFVFGAQALLVGLTMLRLRETRASALGVDECFGCQAATLVQHDAGLWAAFWLLGLLMTLPFRPVRVLAVPLALGLLLLLAADVLALQQFGMRLYLPDVLSYGHQPEFVIDYANQLGAWLWPLLLALIGLAWYVAVLAGRHLATSRARGLLVAMSAGSLLLYALPDRAAHPLPWTYQNLLEANWPGGADREFSPGYLEALVAAPPQSLATKECLPGLAHGGDVIIVAIESLSWYHSTLLLPDGLQATPNFDRLARANAWWPGFLANGFTTDHGLIAMLAGQLPVPAVNRYRSFDVFDGYEGDWRAMPLRLREDGYHTAFITSGDLGFLGKGTWLETLGFDHIEGHLQGEYKGARRYGFGAVDDSLLYRRVLNWLEHDRPDGQPVAAFVETVTTHPPFIDPRSGEPDERGAFGFADQALADFVESLQQRAYFEHGLLIVTSDQRALTPVRQAEIDAFGAAAGAHLPLLVIGARLPEEGKQQSRAQMLDLAFSLDYYLTSQACRLPGQGNLFTAEPPECVLHADGAQRSIVHAFCGDDQAQILMDGDRTRVIEGVLPDAERRLRELNYERARLGTRDANAGMVL